ncbi:MAG TPA: MFS transporter [Roseiflexaceae bacterium]|nr:MFS transporter [Roseiflexaceae bacterium]
MSTEEVSSLPPEAPTAVPQAGVDRRNYRLGLVNGISFTIGESISSPTLVLSLLVRQLGGSLTLVGLMPVIQNVGYLLPQLLVAGRVQAMTHRLPLYRQAGIIRLVAQAALVLAILSAVIFPPEIALVLIIACYTIFNFGGGITTISFQEVVAKVIPLRRRGTFFGTRQLVGGLLAFALGGTLVRWVLGSESPLLFPYNFALLSVISLVGFIIGIGSFALVHEPASQQVGPRTGFVAVLRRAPAILRANRNYRLFIVARLLLRAGQIAEPFYIIYATEALGLSAGVAGVFISIWALAGALSNIVWGRIADRRGNRRLLLLASCLSASAPLLMIGGPALLLALNAPATLLIVALGFVFLLIGAGTDGIMIAAMTYIIEVSPDDERATYLGVANTILGMGAVLPILGSWLISTLGFQPTFAIGAVLALCGLFVVSRLQELRQF